VHAELELTLELPAELALDELAVQAVWSGARGARKLTDALLVTLAR
jgi:hypothetical protein